MAARESTRSQHALQRACMITNKGITVQGDRHHHSKGVKVVPLEEMTTLTFLADNPDEGIDSWKTLGKERTKDPKITSEVKARVNSDVKVPNEETKTSSDVKPEVNSEEEIVIDVITCDEEVIDVEACEEEVIDVVTCEVEVIDISVASKDFEESVVHSDAGAKSKPRIQELSIPLKKLRVTTNCINKRLELEEDEYIFCSKCDKLRIGNCSIHESLNWVKEPSVVLEKEGLTRARSTIPNNMDLKISSIRDAGLGIFAKERFESDVVFGPYWGQKIGVADVAPNMDQSYMWDIIENGRVTRVVDARDEKHSNWLRFVNCARNEDEQNLVAFQFRGEIYYRSYKVIEPGMELLVWYGDRYACDLDILNKDHSDKIADGPIQCQKCFMVCSGPSSLASHNKFRCQMNNEHHLWRCIHCDRSFKTQSSLHMHKNIHKGIKPYACRICGNLFSHPKSRNRHYSLHFIQTCSCKLCGEVFGDTISLGRHERTFHAFKRLSTGKFECVECHKLLANWKCLTQHKKRVPHTNADAFKCKTCGKLFRKRENLLRHEALHKPSYLCRSDKGGKYQKVASNTLQKYPTKGLSVVKGRACSTRRVCEICKAGVLKTNFARHMRQKHPHVKIAKRGNLTKTCVDKHRLAAHIAAPLTRKDGSKPQSLQHQKAEEGKSERTMKASDRKYRNPNHLQDQKAYNNEVFRCEFCSKPFPSLTSMYHHRAAHFRKNNPALPNSFVNSSTAPNKESPSLVDTECGNGKIRCEVCFKEFPSAQLMHCHRASHFRKTNPSREISCEQCGKSFYSNKSLRQHKCCHAQNATIFSRSVKCADNSTFRCNVCNKSFLKERSLRSHMTHHSRNSSQWNVPPSKLLPKCSPESSKLRAEENSFKCDICAREFISKESLKSHKSHHSRSGRKSFLSSPSLQGLQKSCQGQGSFASSPASASMEGVDTNGQRPCVCNICFESFQSNRSLSQHKRSHVGINTAFVCPFCHKGFSFKWNLLRHKRSQHYRPYKHQRCDEGFRTVRGRLGHLKFLSKHGKVKQNLKSSSLTETCYQAKGEALRVYQFGCRHCDKRFVSYSGLYRHTRKYHIEHVSIGPLKCQHCHKEFQNAGGMQAHVNKRHAKEKKSEPCRGLKPEGEGCFETINCDVEESTQTCSKSPRICPWKCQYCSKEFQSVGGMKKHVRKKHGKRKRSDTYQGNKPGGKDGIETTKSEEAGRSQTCSKPAKFGPLKCQYCSKEFQSESGIKKHVKKKHGKRMKSGSYQQCKPKGKGSIEAASSEMANGTQVCPGCEVRFFTFGSGDKHIHCIHCSRVLSLEKNATGSGLKRQFVCNSIQGRAQSIPEKNSGLSRPFRASARAFQCRYCLKGFSTINSLYKHIMIAHKNDFGSNTQRSCNRMDDQSVRRIISIHQACTTQVSKEGVQIGDEKDESANIKFATVKNKLCKARTKSSPLTNRFRCRHCSRRFFTKNSRRKHEVKLHGKQVESSSLRSKLDVDKNGINKPLNESPLSSDDFLSALKNGEKISRACTDGPNAKECHLRDKSFPCEYCPKQFLRVSSRYKHVMLVHTRPANATYRVCQSKQKVPIGRSTRRTSDRGTGCSLSPAKRKATTWSSDCQPESKKFRRHGINLGSTPDGCRTPAKDISADHGAMWPLNKSKAFPCEFCDKRFSSFSLQCKHFFLAHSGSEALAQQGLLDSKSKVANKVPEMTESLLHVTSNDCVSSTDYGNLTRQHSFSSQSSILKYCISAADNCSSEFSVPGAAREPYKCGICCTTLRTKGEWTKHFDEIHNGKVGEAVHSINGLSRPPLRTISSSLQNSNKLKSLRSRRGSHTEVTYSKQVNVSSRHRSKFVNPNSSVSAVQSGTKLTKKRFKCDICHALFSEHRSISRHKQSRHSDERPFQCTICGFATKRKDHLSIHERLHLGRF
ncbi:hypothetical protein ACROYT_G008097 [Oculina patagonica]